MTTLHAEAGDLSLNAIGELTHAEGAYYYAPFYLTDPTGNYLTDTLGNRLIGYSAYLAFPAILHTVPDDFRLNSEQL